jgi:hypothetical protein
VVDDCPDIVERRVRVEAEIEARLVFVGLGAATSAASAQILHDDVWPVGRGKFLKADVSRPAAADHRVTASCPNVPYPL